MMMRERDYTLITGGAGFIGSNLADALLSDGRGGRDPGQPLPGRGGEERRVAARPHGSAVCGSRWATSPTRTWSPAGPGCEGGLPPGGAGGGDDLARRPALDLQSNLIGTFNVLEAARALPAPPPILFTSTNKVYGGLDWGPGREGGRCGTATRTDGRDRPRAPLDFHSPYGCSKGAADQYVRDYARIYGIPTVVFRMSCVYGARQFGTEDQGWVAHFARASGRISDHHLRRRMSRSATSSGSATWSMAMRVAIDRADGSPGRGLQYRRRHRKRRIRAACDRPADGDHRHAGAGGDGGMAAGTSKAARLLGWRPTTPWRLGLERLVGWLGEADLGPTDVPFGRDPAGRAFRAAL
jgi:CDP-paratose 2-epimerase